MFNTVYFSLKIANVFITVYFLHLFRSTTCFGSSYEPSSSYFP